MAIQFIPRTHTFDAPGLQQGGYDFLNKVRAAGGAIQAYALGYENNDNHVRDIQVQVSNVAFSGSRVSYDLSFKLNDNGGRKGKAEIVVLIMADTEAL